MTVLDLFCGIGWGCALESLGLTEHGIDSDPDVAATRALHGWDTTCADITTLDPADFGQPSLLIASPPCQSFSAAGKRAGLDDPRGQLVWQVPRWVAALLPDVVVCEQVPAVLPIWRLIGHELDRHGYRWWAGCLSAEQWGVPQTRNRAILIARRDGRSPLPPEPTHRRYVSGVGRDEGDPSLLPWVSMADALGFGHGGVAGFPRRNDRDDGAEYRERDWHSMDEPAATATEKWRSWIVDLRQQGSKTVPYPENTVTRPVDDPAPTLGTKSGGQWVLRDRQANGAERRAGEPAPTILASLDNGNKAWQSDDARPIRLTIPQGLVLQGFPADFALAGTKTSQWRQIGNSVAPPFAAALLAHVLDLAPVAP